jgi:hypothetical protein
MSSKEENVRWIFDKLGWANAHELALDIYLASSTIPKPGESGRLRNIIPRLRPEAGTFHVCITPTSTAQV